MPGRNWSKARATSVVISRKPPEYRSLDTGLTGGIARQPVVVLGRPHKPVWYGFDSRPRKHVTRGDYEQKHQRS